MSYEKSDLPPKGVVIFILGIVLALLGGLLITIPLLSQARKIEASGHAPDHPLAERNADRPEPRLQVFPSKELTTHEAEVAAEQDSYGWIDDTKVRVPIERAMDLVLEEGLP